MGGIFGRGRGGGGGGGGGVQYIRDPQAEARAREAEARVRALGLQQEELQAQLQRIQNEYQQEGIRWRNELEEFKERARAKEDELLRMQDELQQHEINSLDELEAKDRTRFERIIALARSLEPAPIRGCYIGFIGNTSVGKSSLINSCIGEEVCETGLGQVTLEPKPYNSPPSALLFWDLPGKNDDISYLRAPYISTMKSMAFIGVVITATVSEITSVLRLLQALQVSYHIIVNKVDQARNHQQLERFKAQINREVAGLGDCCRGTFFISAEHPGTHDWLKLMDAITASERK
jgi:GTP-binding protein EngB required for normal cell division